MTHNYNGNLTSQCKALRSCRDQGDTTSHPEAAGVPEQLPSTGAPATSTKHIPGHPALMMDVCANCMQPLLPTKTALPLLQLFGNSGGVVGRRQSVLLSPPTFGGSLLMVPLFPMLQPAAYASLQFASVTVDFFWNAVGTKHKPDAAWRILLPLTGGGPGPGEGPGGEGGEGGCEHGGLVHSVHNGPRKPLFFCLYSSIEMQSV